jgi:S-adenosylmethionine hydrolase
VTRPITFLSDYGLADEFVGVVHGVIAGICPEARVIDLTHGIPRQDVLAGARVLARSLPYVPAGVHLAVVDPEVGARRRAVALRTIEEGRLLVGPDNGLLMPAAERFGGVAEVVEISASPWRLEPVSATFHGRDLFAPIAARLAAGAPLGAAGTPLEPAELVTREHSQPRQEADALVAHVVGIDGFGNAILDGAHDDLVASGLRLGDAVAARVGGRRVRGVVARTFSDVAAVKGRRHGFQAQRRAADVDGLDDPAEALGGGHQQPVVGTDEEAVLLGAAQRDGPALGPDLGVDDRQVHAGGHVRQCAAQDQCAGADVVPGDPVRDVDDPRRRRDPGDDAVADADEVVVEPIVAEERHVRHAPVESRCAFRRTRRRRQDDVGLLPGARAVHCAEGGGETDRSLS